MSTEGKSCMFRWNFSVYFEEDTVLFLHSMLAGSLNFMSSLKKRRSQHQLYNLASALTKQPGVSYPARKDKQTEPLAHRT